MAHEALHATLAAALTAKPSGPGPGGVNTHLTPEVANLLAAAQIQALIDAGYLDGPDLDHPCPRCVTVECVWSDTIGWRCPACRLCVAEPRSWNGGPR